MKKFLFLNNFFNFLRFEETHEKINGILILIGLILVFKNLYTLYYNHAKSKIFPKWKTAFSEKLMRIYLFSDYSSFLLKGSSAIIKNLSLVNLIFEQFLLSYINTIINLSLLFFILGILIIILPVEILLAIFFAIFCVTLLYKVIKKPIENIGERLNDIFEKRQSILRQSTGMIKEVKIMNKEDYFTRKFSDIENRNFKEQAYYNFISTIPPLVVELIVVISTLLVIGFVLIYSEDDQLGIAIIGVIATTLFRLMPIFNRQLSYLQMMNLSKDAVDTIGKEFKKTKIILPNIRDKKSEFNFSQKVIFKKVFLNIQILKKIVLKILIFQ